MPYFAMPQYESLTCTILRRFKWGVWGPPWSDSMNRICISNFQKNKKHARPLMAYRGVGSCGRPPGYRDV